MTMSVGTSVSMSEAQLHALQDWLQGQWPQREQIELRDVRPPIQGFSNETWLFDIHWQEGGVAGQEAAVLRLAPEGTGLFRDYDLAVQYRCMKQLAGSDVPVPQMLGEAGVLDAAAVSPLQRPFYLMNRLPGRAPTEQPLYHLEGWLYELPAERQRAVWLNGVEMIARVNRVDWQAGGFEFLLPAGMARDASAAQLLAGQLDQQAGFLAWAESLAEPYPLLRAALAWLQANQPAAGPVSVCWGDAKLGNCLFDVETDACSGVLDWESVELGNPVADLAWWLMLDRSLCDGYGLPRLAGLPSRDETVAHWCAHSGHAAGNLAYFEIFAAFKFALIMARIGCLFMARGWVPQEQRMDLNNGGSAILRILAAEQSLPFAGESQ